MCGIAGFFDPAHKTREPLHVLRSMGDAIAHRGPDGRGEWFDPSPGIGLAHRRLAIIDLSDAGAQPMCSHCGRFVISLNGEIYNFEALRSDLESEGSAPVWRGYSDTEVLLACISAWGVERTLKKCNGMFAFAVWDARDRELILARDRFGEKPLYYGWRGRVLLFASELKALDRYPERSSEIDTTALGLLLQFNYIPAPYCIWQGLKKLLPGTWARFRAREGDVEQVGEVHRYWSAIECALDATQNRLTVSDTEAVDLVDKTLREAVGIRTRADVPLGAFLSGGVDSSAVVAAMQAQSMRPVQTYSISYADPLYNEGAYAGAVARHLGTRHEDLRVEPSQARDVIPLLPRMYDEPFADASQIPTFLVAQLARTGVTVSLSGDGGDELFGGYNRHVWGPRLWRRLGGLPQWLRSGVARGLHAIPPKAWNRFLGTAGFLLPALRSVHAPGYKLHKFAGICDAFDEAELYQRMISFWRDPALAVPGFERRSVPAMYREAWPQGMDFAESMMLQDAVSYLPDDILAKVDRASMAVALEARVPFLDPALFELAWRLPHGLRVRGDSGKWVLREVLCRYVPRELIDRPKMGFGIPVGQWLRGELREWAEDLLSESALRKSGMLDPKPIRRVWNEHLSGSLDWEYHLWSVLMFQSWLRDGSGP